MILIKINVPGVCLMSAYNVPYVCTYLGVRTILKYKVKRFPTLRPELNSGIKGATLSRVRRAELIQSALRITDPDESNSKI